MGYLIGTDEAGYGPNLGPLVISATVWEAPDGVSGEDLFDQVGHVIARELSRVSADGGPRIAMADSKVLYQSGGSLRNLERGLWAALGLLEFRPRTWRNVWHCLAPDALDDMPSIPWYVNYDAPAPLDCDAEEIESFVEALQMGLAAAGVRLVAVRSRAIFADRFNALIDRYGSKGTALSQQTLALAAQMVETLPRAPISLVCDKHGGRNRYAPLLAEHFPEWLVEIRGEGRREAPTASGRRSGAWRSVSARRPNRACRPRWLRWPPSISASWRCGR